MNNTKFIFLYGLITIVGIAGVVYLYPHVHFMGAINFQTAGDETAAIVNELLNEAGHPMDEYYYTRLITRNRQVTLLSESQYGIRKSNAALRDSVPGYRRTFRWYTEPPYKFPDLILPNLRERAPGEPVMSIDGLGRLSHFQIQLPDTSDLPSLTEEEASARVISFIGQYSRFSQDRLLLDSVERETKRYRTDWRFTYTADDNFLGQTVTIDAIVAGNTISQYRERYELPERLSVERTDFLVQIQIIIAYLIIILILLFIVVKRLRSGEIGLKNALVAGFIATVAFLMQFWILNIMYFQLYMIMLGVLNAVIIGLGIVIGWAASESVGRQTWREKFIALDLLTRGHLLHSTIGKGVIRGAALGIVIYLIYSGVTLLLNYIYPIWFAFPSEVIYYISSHIASVHALMQSTLSAILFSSLIFIIFSSIVRQYTSAPLLIIGIPALIFTLAHSAAIRPIGGSIIILLSYGILITWVFYRFDIITLLIAVMTIELFEWGLVFFFAGETVLLQHGIGWAIVFGGIWVFGMTSLYTKDSEYEESNIAPGFQRFISERERLQREFEIAREVQTGFLPANTPVITGLDIAARCLPARAIGGDYYDFIYPEENNTVIVIGDVSGKGTQAAFYMTLVKGFIHASANDTGSPAEILKKINRHFYATTDRGAFISMIYSIFNHRTNTLILSRAGHNPIIYFNSKTKRAEFLRPNGIAIGLHKYRLFDDTIDDTTIHVHSGDIIIFYTDGITEAMNKRNEEFGDERLLQIIEKYNEFDASTLLNKIIDEVSYFTKHTEQTDDMTMVVIKRK